MNADLLNPKPNTQPAVVSARALTRIYGRQRAVDAIDFSVSRGETFGLLGPNGAGKSTTMRMIACRTPLTSGELLVEGLDVRGFDLLVDARDDTILDEDVDLCVELLARVDDAAVCDENVHDKAESRKQKAEMFGASTSGQKAEIFGASISAF